MNLLRVELTRFRKRRAILALAVIAILLSGLFAAKLAWDTRPITASDQATAQAQADIEAKGQQVQDDLSRCQDDPAAYVGSNATAGDCADTILPKAAWYLDRSPLDVSEVLPGFGVGVAILLVALLVVAGTTFAGADWASGAISNQLLFESRRPRIWGAKALALAIGALVVAALALAAFWVPIGLIATERGIPVSGAVTTAVGWHLVRTLVLAVLGAVLAYGLTMLFRHTVATVALLFGVSVAAEILLSLLPYAGSGRVSPSHNVFAWLLGRTTYYDPSIRCLGADGCDHLRTLQMWPAGLLMAGVLLVVAVVSVGSFQRRDVP